jgi:hypothetical protein
LPVAIWQVGKGSELVTAREYQGSTAMRCEDEGWWRASMSGCPGPEAVPHPWRDEPGAPRGERNGNFKDGLWTCEAVQEGRAKEMLKLYANGPTNDRNRTDTARIHL